MDVTGAIVRFTDERVLFEPLGAVIPVIIVLSLNTMRVIIIKCILDTVRLYSIKILDHLRNYHSAAGVM